MEENPHAEGHKRMIEFHRNEISQIQSGKRPSVRQNKHSDMPAGARVPSAPSAIQHHRQEIAHHASQYHGLTGRNPYGN